MAGRKTTSENGKLADFEGLPRVNRLVMLFLRARLVPASAHLHRIPVSNRSHSCAKSSGQSCRLAKESCSIRSRVAVRRWRQLKRTTIEVLELNAIRAISTWRAPRYRDWRGLGFS